MVYPSKREYAFLTFIHHIQTEKPNTVSTPGGMDVEVYCRPVKKRNKKQKAKVMDGK